MKFFLIIIFIFLNSCSSVRESAGVNRKSIDEFNVIENPPLIIPPDFNLLLTDQIVGKQLDISESELAKEILFGLDEDEISLKKMIGTMNQILINAEALDVSDTIREEIDRDFAQEINVDEIFQMKWENEVEILDAIKESERIRNNKFNGESLSNGEVPTKMEVIQEKKKKRFYLF